MGLAEDTIRRLWAQNGLKPAVAEIYARFLRGYGAYCVAHRMDPVSELTAEGAKVFSRWYVRVQRRRAPGPSDYPVLKSALRAYAWALGATGSRVPEWKKVRSQVSPWPIVEEYLMQAREQRGLASNSVLRVRAELDRFVVALRAKHITWSQLRGCDIDRFLLRCKNRFAPGTVAQIASDIRGFLRFLFATGRIPHDLGFAVITPVRRSPDQPPRSLPWPTVRKIIRAIDPTSSLGRRDRAQFLLMSACGLGAAEVLRLELSDVDWEAHRLHVVRCKTGTPLWLPLLPEIARALADYIRYARPRPTAARQIFLSQQMPFRALTGSSALGHRVNVLARRAGLKEHCGTHRFRHSHATRQVEIGTDMKTLADILGHRDAETTSLYTRGAVQRLRRLALPLPK